ncbi:hypothetical protein F0562_035200 [Nyssa sinensis]|uniref:PGG domain-containing protein n=1 Tax=Nyssa sinensis TaxID=561372 RepID=A0A5J5AFC3_9ASTE|nr:hypothetical protein F0562_035200 [Nyssa sinensis]
MPSEIEVSTQEERDYQNDKKQEAADLFEIAMRGEWNKVVEVYRSNRFAREAKLTKLGDTALHIAVTDGDEDIVQIMVESIPKEDASGILNLKNGRENTALHLAAALGNKAICQCIGSKDPKVINARNVEGETPLFVAVRNGKQEAFLCLHELYNNGKRETDYMPCRKHNGDTVLHSAISGEYFSLAFQITIHYPMLIEAVNEDGFSPLHILANMPNAFKSSCQLRLFDRIIYHCTPVNELKEETYVEANKNNSGGESDLNYPENYRTCMNFFNLLETTIWTLASPVKGRGWILSLRSWWTEGKGSTSPDEENLQQKSSHGGDKARREDSFPYNYATCVLFFKLVIKSLLIILGFGFGRIKKIQKKKMEHAQAVQIMNKLVHHASTYKYEDNGLKPQKSPTDKDGTRIVFPNSSSSMEDRNIPSSPDSVNSLAANQEKYQNKKDEQGLEKREAPILVAAKMGLTDMVDKFLKVYPDAIQDLNSAQKNIVFLTYEKKQTHALGKKETPLLIAAKMGVTEMVEKILDTFPVAIQDLDSRKKNVVLLAVENRQARVYNLLRSRTILKESMLHQVDDQGNSALHLAAMYGDHQPWRIPGAALQMQWEIKWYKFVKQSMPSQFFARYNKKGETAREIFTHTHKDLLKNGCEWLIKTSESCSVVAALIATVAFATSATVPGGINEDTGTPTLEREPAFDVFAISSLAALCFSVTALVFFLAILTSRCQEKDFHKDLPRKLLLGLTSLFTSIASMLFSFCAGHFFILRDNLKFAAFPVYLITCLPVSFFAVAQLPLYFDLFWAILAKVPQRSSKMFPHY